MAFGEERYLMGQPSHFPLWSQGSLSRNTESKASASLLHL